MRKDVAVSSKKLKEFKPWALHLIALPLYAQRSSYRVEMIPLEMPYYLSRAAGSKMGF